MLLQLLVVFVEFSKLVWKNISIGHKVKMLFAESLLHTDNVEAETVLTSNFITHREVIDLLILIESFITITFTARRRP